VIGLLLGWPGVLAGLVLAVLIAGAVTLVYLLVMVISRRYTPNLALPYGPFLAASAIFLLFFR
jgi:prepilin signal peptidase PulO-like enzyme (type II secretory pathway)